MSYIEVRIYLDKNGYDSMQLLDNCGFGNCDFDEAEGNRIVVGLIKYRPYASTKMVEDLMLTVIDASNGVKE